MFNIRTTAPAIEPVTLDQQKAFMRIQENTADDTLIETLITAAREFVELYTKLALITQTWRYTLDFLPGVGQEAWWDGVREGALVSLQETARFIELPTGPLISVTSFLAYNEADVGTPFTGYYLDTGRRPGRVALRSGGIWPVSTRGVAGYEITYTAGFGAAAANVPADLRLAVNQIASHWYENRELMTFEVSARDVPMSATRILDQRRVIRI